MYELLNFFNNISDELRITFLIGGLAFFLFLESGVPLFRMKYDKFGHAGINIMFTIITLIINLIGAIGIVKAVEYNKINSSGILNLINVPIGFYIIIGLLLMDFIGAWVIHWIQHNIKWMWKFHIIHHSDPHVDVTTGLRHHPGENIFRLLFTIIAVLISGANFGLVMMYQTISVFFAHLTHANIAIPSSVDKILSYIIVTPNFHKIHHHYLQPHTDSNYGNIFSIWDRMFQTTTLIKNKHNIRYGIDTHLDSEENSSIKNLLMIPFQPYRYPSRIKKTH